MNHKIDKEKKSNKKKRSEFEFCKVCNLNHDQGRSHKYYPNHKKPLFDFLSRFQSKLDDIRFFVKNPSLLSPDHASLNRFWCVFCDTDIDDIGSSFGCAHAIHHLESADHLKNLKHFLWTYGGGMDCMDTFQILEADVAKCYTNQYQISNSGLSADANVGQFVLDAVSSLSADALTGRGLWNSNDLTVHWKSQQLLPCRSVPSSCNLSGVVHSKFHKFPPCFLRAGGNVHTGALPPWLEATEEHQMNAQSKPVSSSFVSFSNKPGKKLNPKRVGAAWAERRKIEMEKRGEIVKSDYDANWLPNFGRVWQSGSRKESRKEFEMEKEN